MTGNVRSEAVRAHMNALYLRLRRGSEGMFAHDGLLHFGVPAAVVRAYVEAAFERRPAYEAVCVAWFGREGLEIAKAWPGGMFDRAARGWIARLDGLAAAAAERAEAAA